MKASRIMLDVKSSVNEKVILTIPLFTWRKVLMIRYVDADIAYSGGSR